ncbi:MAG: hypothetical protein AAF399_21945 [Bacteroidota bacterium]
MNPFASASTPLSPGWVILKMILLLIATIMGVFLAAKLFPLPKGQGLAYVAHPFFALAGGGIISVVYLILGLTKSPGENKVFWWGLGISLAWSMLVFSRVI